MEIMTEPSVGQPSNSPPNNMDDDNIRGGLGSLNRWSQSTTSSNFSPNLPSHRRQESAPRLFATDDHVSHRKGPSLDTGSETRLPNQAFDEAERDGQPTRHYTHQPSASLGYAEMSTRERPEMIVISQGSTLPESDASPRESTPVQYESQIQRRSPEKGPLRQTAADYSSQGPPRSHTLNDKRKQGPSQKAMLSKALQKANTAVLLDNAANFEGAMEAYNDACQLLQLVMLRSNGGEDEKLKLQEIRDTYMIRVTELQRMDFTFRNSDSKALPERPLSQESYGDYLPTNQEDDYSFASDDPGFLQQDSLSTQGTTFKGSRMLVQPHIPPRRQSLLPSALDDGPHTPSFSVRSQADISRSVLHTRENSGAAPPFLEDPILEEETPPHKSGLSELSVLSTHDTGVHESTSWLDTIDESGASSASSIHSKVSSVYLRRRRSARLSHGTEAEFDAALDAAVEAAYDEGLVPASDSEGEDDKDDVFANARRNVEIAKQKVREAEREAEVAMQERERRRVQEQEMVANLKDPELDYLDEEAEEEERLLEEMTRGYVMDDFEFDLQSKSALPRQSTSTSFAGHNWESPVVMNPIATGATLPPLVEDDTLPVEQNNAPQPTESDGPPVATQPTSRPMSGLGVRARRMSGQTSVELKIETSRRSRSGSINLELPQTQDSRTRPPAPLEMDEDSPSLAAHTNNIPVTTPSTARQAVRNVSISSINEGTLPNLSLAREITAVEEEDDGTGASKMLSPSHPQIGKVPSAPDNLGRPQAATLPFRARNVSVPNSDIYTESPATPSGHAFPTLDLQRGITTATINALPTPTAANFGSSGLPSDGLYLFDSYIHSPTSPGSPNPLAPNSPLPLEPCPESFLLRPFWLMRCIYQTIAHPRGGYLSTKLFVPRDVWRVKNVKIKAIEEKISNCDLLTAALLKLAKVDTYDADAVLEEMQTFESVLDQVQISLSKKMGSEVGVQGAMPLFKAAQTLDDATTIDALPSRASNGPGKSYLSSWRKLRSKNSGFGAAPLAAPKEATKDHLTISSLPMTSVLNNQPTKRNFTQLQFNGPNANYMSALARLCDAAQVLDQIAQQVEDPGLRHSSQTLVGLELSTRHAAEFFGFYICRFALSDIGMMLDKFIKRGSEWVLL
ncbi:hypothetical protein BJX63DRAFT_286991 [Aspergillus granulosus]|uniref:MIT domain-containing protein n=1 Tax=Aspergillus granulosus TaxID=176169 RepID=A0ABR4H8Q7_9EURO